MAQVTVISDDTHATSQLNKILRKMPGHVCSPICCISYSSLLIRTNNLSY